MNLGMRVRDPVINLHFRFKIASLGFDAAGAPTFLCGPLLTTEFMGQLYLQLPNSFYFPSMVTNMARNFEYWRLPRFKLLWRTRLGTTSQSFLHCAFFPDPEYLQSIGVSAATSLLNQGNLQNTPNCGQWPAWKNMDCPEFSQRKWLYTAGPQISTRYDFAGISSVERQTCAGVFGFVLESTPSLGTAITVGDFYMDMDVQLRNMVSAFTTVTPKPSLDSRLKDIEKQLSALSLDYKEEKTPSEILISRLQERGERDLGDVDTYVRVLDDRKVRAPTPIPKKSSSLK